MKPGERLVVRAGDKVTIRDLVRGYCRAFYRFKAEQDQARTSGYGQQVKDRAWTALFEALNWADSVDQFLGRGPTDRGGKADWLTHLSPDHRLVAKGLQHVRNVVHHQWWTALATEILVETAGQQNTWIWSPLPPNNGGKEGQRAYAQALHGKPVEETLETLRDVFWPLRLWGIEASDLDQPAYPVPCGVPVDA